MRAGRRFVLSGRVQGIGYRFFAYETAMREGVSGYVRNLPDRRVEVVAEGELEAVTRFERAIRQGPIGARVDEVETDMLPASGQYAGFSIKR